MRKFENNIVIFSVMLCWASAYVFIKGLPEELTDFGYLALMNGIAALILVLLFLPRLAKLTKQTLIHSIVLGLLMTLVLLFEKEGIDRLAPASASVLTSLDIVIVPVVMMFLLKMPTRSQIIAIVLILTGVLITNGVDPDEFPVAGTLFMLGDCICMSFYNVVSNRYTQEDDPILLAVVQLVVMAIVSMVIWNLESPGQIFMLEYDRSFLSSLFVLAIFTKAFAYIMLMFGEKYGDPVDVVLIFALEPVITLILSVFIPESFGGVEEDFSLRALVGAVVIVIGSMIGNLDWKEVFRRLKRSEVPQ
ncbi:MAG: DMT family transporter [Lachnospiraceae bacterium]|nr:DMT family transporter [Lachnospiraceae bacterium]